MKRLVRKMSNFQLNQSIIRIMFRWRYLLLYNQMPQKVKNNCIALRVCARCLEKWEENLSHRMVRHDFYWQRCSGAGDGATISTYCHFNYSRITSSARSLLLSIFAFRSNGVCRPNDLHAFDFAFNLFNLEWNWLISLSRTQFILCSKSPTAFIGANAKDKSVSSVKWYQYHCSLFMPSIPEYLSTFWIRKMKFSHAFSLYGELRCFVVA